jgi:GT2 family glycosyltransferase
MTKEAISVVIPTYKRIKDLSLTLTNIYSCNPLPLEIIVHVDFGDLDTREFLKNNFPQVVVLNSKEPVGPGGGRNVGIKYAKNNYVASFDDDSFPIDNNYFANLTKYFKLFPLAVVIEAAIYHKDEQVNPPEKTCFEKHNFTGCGSAYRKDLFLKLGGFIPKPVAYGIEEVDLSIRALEKKMMIVGCKELRVLHNTNLKHHQSTKINAGLITNSALFVYLRYPYQLYFYGFLQVMNKIFFAVTNKRYNGIFKGLVDIPSTIKKYKQYRRVIPRGVIKNFLEKRSLSKRIYDEVNF